MDMIEQNRLCCISHWLPILERAGIPVPRTELVRTAPDVEWPDLMSLLDGQQPEGWMGFFARLTSAVSRMGNGSPVFLRTGQTAGKHAWDTTCHLKNLEDTTRHVCGLVEYSVMCGVMGLPTDVWAVRELLPTEPIAFMPRYGNMPLVTELRAFVQGGEVLCTHQYWPVAAVKQGLAPPGRSDHPLGEDGWPELPDGLSGSMLYALLCSIPMDEMKAVWKLLERVAQVIADGSDNFHTRWSVDLLQCTDPERPWVVTDMALGDVSYHDPACPRCLSPRVRFMRG